MSRKLKTTAVILAIIMAITAYIGYNALKGVSDALQTDDIWSELD